MDKNIKWQPIIELIIVLVTVLGSTITLYIHTDNKMEKNIAQMRSEFIASMKAQNERMEKMNERTDRLYEMFIEIVKEKK